MIAGNYTLYTKFDFYEIVNAVVNFLGKQLSIKHDLLNGLNNERLKYFNPTTKRAKIPLYKFLSSSTPTYSLINTVQILTKMVLYAVRLE